MPGEIGREAALLTLGGWGRAKPICPSGKRQVSASGLAPDAELDVVLEHTHRITSSVARGEHDAWRDRPSIARFSFC
jgi:hypothetical protein